MSIALALIIITCIISYKGLTSEAFMDRYSFVISQVQEEKDYIRMLSSGFLHVSWLHLIVNMLVLFGFGSGLEQNGMVGHLQMPVIYLASMIGGNLFALWIHSDHPSYASVGASGAVSGLVFATIALFPSRELMLFPLPVAVPTWIFGVLYVAYTIYAIRSRRTDVGHAAHLGGAIIGMLTAILFHPSTIVDHWLPILLVLLPASALIFVMIYRPDIILIDRRTRRRQLTMDDKFNLDYRAQRAEVDRILEKINEKGMSSLNRRERKLLEEYARK